MQKIKTKLGAKGGAHFGSPTPACFQLVPFVMRRSGRARRPTRREEEFDYSNDEVGEESSESYDLPAHSRQRQALTKLPHDPAKAVGTYCL